MSTPDTMKTAEEDRFYINGTAGKINLFNQALAKVIEGKILTKRDSLNTAVVWNNYKTSGFMEARNRHALHDCIIGTEMDTKESVQTTIKRVYLEIIDNIPGILNYFDFHNIKNQSNLFVTSKINEEIEVTQDSDDETVQEDSKITVNEADKNAWSTVEGDFTPPIFMNPNKGKEGFQKNNFEELMDEDDDDDISDLYTEDLKSRLSQESETSDKNKNICKNEIIIPLLGVNTLCNEIYQNLTLYLDTHDQPAWKKIWNNWINNDFINVTNVVQLAECVNAPAEHVTMKSVFDYMANEIATIKEVYDLQHDKGENYLIEKKEKIDNLNKNKKNNNKTNQMKEAITKTEINTVGKAIADGSVDELEVNLLCKWILHKGAEVQEMCDTISKVEKKCKTTMESAIKKDSDTILNTIEKASIKFANQMNDVTNDAKEEFKSIQIKMNDVQTRSHSNVKTHQKIIDKAKGELKKAEYEGIVTLNNNANDHIQFMNNLVNKSSELLDKLHGTHQITATKQKEIDNMMIILQKRIHGATDKFEEVICSTTDKERTSFIEWMNKRMRFLDNKEGEGDTINQLMMKHHKLELAIEEMATERTKIRAERLLLEGDRHVFNQWWNTIKNKLDNQHTNQQPPTNSQRYSEHHESDSDPPSLNQQSSSSSSSVYINNEPKLFTFKKVDMHDENPKQSPKHGKLNHNIPQANQQILRLDRLTADEFPPEVQPPMKEGTQVQYQQNIYNYIGVISYDNLPVFINDTWYYDLVTTRNVKLNNCSSKYMTEIHEVVPGDSREQLKKSRGDYIPYQQQPPPHQPSNHSAMPWNNNIIAEPKYPIKREQSTNYETSQSHHQGKPWIKPRLAPNEFVYPLESHPIKVLHHDITKYGNKWNLTILNKDEFRTFYEDLRNQMRTYHVYLINYDSIELNQSLTELTPNNCENYSIAVSEMSRALFNFFSNNKDTIFEHYTDPINSLETYRPYSNGFGFLMNMMKRTHPTLKRRLVTSGPALPPIPEFEYYPTIHKFINAIVAHRQDELHTGRHYSQKELLLHICHSLDERFTSATYKIQKELREAISNPSCPRPLPAFLEIDNELAIRIMELIDEEDRDQDFDNKEPTSRAVIKKTNYGGNYKEKYNRDSKLDQRKNTGYNTNRNNKNDKWEDTLKWEIIDGAECAGCRRNNHDVYRTGCPAFAQFALCQEFYKTVPSEQLEKVKQAFLKHQKSRRLAMSNKKKDYKSTIRTLQADPDYDEHEIAKLRKTFFEKYKNEFKEERNIDSNPFDEDINLDHTEE